MNPIEIIIATIAIGWTLGLATWGLASIARKRGKAWIIAIDPDAKTADVRLGRVKRGTIRVRGHPFPVPVLGECKYGGKRAAWFVNASSREGWNYRFPSPSKLLADAAAFFRFPTRSETIHADPVIALAASIGNPFTLAKQRQVKTIGDAAHINVEREAFPWPLVAAIALVTGLLLGMGLLWIAMHAATSATAAATATHAAR